MSPGINGRFPGGGSGKAGIFEAEERQQDTTPATAPAQHADEAGKAAAVRAFNLGWISQSQCDALFALHPNWRAA